MLELALPAFISSLVVLQAAPAFEHALASVRAHRARTAPVSANMFLVRLCAVAHEHLERDLDDMWRRNNITRSVRHMLVSVLPRERNCFAGWFAACGRVAKRLCSSALVTLLPRMWCEACSCYICHWTQKWTCKCGRVAGSLVCGVSMWQQSPTRMHIVYDPVSVRAAHVRGQLEREYPPSCLCLIRRQLLTCQTLLLPMSQESCPSARIL